MHYYDYVPHRFSASSVELINTADEIIREYQDQGYDLTLRQLYYQFVARDIIPNAQKEYKRLGSIVNDARLAGMLPWDAIVDRTRQVRMNSHWQLPSDIIQSAAESFRIDLRADQPNYVEVWVEKEALAGIVGNASEELDVPYFSCRGYVSASAMWRASHRFLKARRDGKGLYILHLGDHDPSGIDMTRDIQDRLRMFQVDVRVLRIALNIHQVDEYNPPPNPTKLTDSRSGDYIAEYGMESWELDALDPSILDDLIRSYVDDLTDADRLFAAQVRQRGYKRTLRTAANRWDEVVEFLRRTDDK